MLGEVLGEVPGARPVSETAVAACRVRLPVGNPQGRIKLINRDGEMLPGELENSPETVGPREDVHQSHVGVLSLIGSPTPPATQVEPGELR